jgi:hypothetical protein
MILNVFRALLCSSSGGQLYIYSIWYRPTLYAAIQCTDQERTALLSSGDSHFLNSFAYVPSFSVHCLKNL